MNIYDTDIKNLTCSCEDWKQERVNYPINDPRRLCKHIINKFDIDNLPDEIKYFREAINFYKIKEWGFKKDFEKIIKLPINNLRILFSYQWMNVYDKNGNEFGFLIEQSSNNMIWAKNKKPKGYYEVEDYFKTKKIGIPTKLLKKEKIDLINFIKDKIPNKKDYYITIVEDQYLPTPDGIYYWYEESLTKELTESSIPPYCKEDDIKDIKVKHNIIIINMYFSENLIFYRDLEIINRVKKNQLINEQKILEKTNKKIEKQKQILENEKKVALEKGYLLSYDYKDDDFELTSTGEYQSQYWDKKDKIMSTYDTSTNLLKAFDTSLTTAKFHSELKSLGMIIKDKKLNLGDWIIKNNGLKYGINLEKDSQYMHSNIPRWYIASIFSKKNSELINKTHKVKMTKMLWKKDSFENLLNIMEESIKQTITQTNVKKSVIKEKHEEREKWLKNIKCPYCDSKNIHKKDKRQRKEFKVQRYQCMDCKKIFQEKIEEVIKMDELNSDDVMNNISSSVTQKILINESKEDNIIEEKETQQMNIFKKVFNFLNK